MFCIKSLQSFKLLFSFSLFSIQKKELIQEEEGGIGIHFLGCLGSWRSDGCFRWTTLTIDVNCLWKYMLQESSLIQTQPGFFSLDGTICIPGAFLGVVCIYPVLDLSAASSEIFEADSFRNPPYYSISQFVAAFHDWRMCKICFGHVISPRLFRGRCWEEW